MSFPSIPCYTETLFHPFSSHFIFCFTWSHYGSKMGCKCASYELQLNSVKLNFLLHSICMCVCELMRVSLVFSSKSTPSLLAHATSLIICPSSSFLASQRSHWKRNFFPKMSSCTSTYSRCQPAAGPDNTNTHLFWAYKHIQVWWQANLEFNFLICSSQVLFWALWLAHLSCRAKCALSRARPSWGCQGNGTCPSVCAQTCWCCCFLSESAFQCHRSLQK